MSFHGNSYETLEVEKQLEKLNKRLDSIDNQLEEIRNSLGAMSGLMAHVNASLDRIIEVFEKGTR